MMLSPPPTLQSSPPIVSPTTFQSSPPILRGMASSPKRVGAVQPTAMRAFHPAFASFTSASSEENQPPRVAYRASNISGPHILELLQAKAEAAIPAKGDDVVPYDCCAELDGAVVKVLGWRTAESGKHVVYTILAASRCNDGSEARYVQRRFKDFSKLHDALVPHARRAGVRLPALPSKLSSLVVAPEALGAQRKVALHEWLGLVVAQPHLRRAAELRSFLGLGLPAAGIVEEEEGVQAPMDVAPVAVPTHSAIDLSELDALASQALGIWDDNM